MNKIALIAGLCAFALAAHAADVPTPLAIGTDHGITISDKRLVDPTKQVTDPHRHPFLPCAAAEPDCAKDQTLGFFIYNALGSAPQHDPRGGPQGLDPETSVRAKLGWDLYEATAPVELTEAQRVMIRKALFQNLTMPNIAYAACRMLGDPGECEHP